MQIIKCFFLVAFSVITTSFSSGQQYTRIDLPGLLKPERDPNLSEIASSLEFIKLHTHSDHLLGTIRGVASWGNQLLIQANGGKSLFVFDRKGNFIKEVGKRGKGPGEFLEIYGLTVDPKTNHIYLLDNGQVKVVEFCEKGDFVAEKKLGFYATGILKLDQGFLFYTGSVYSYRTEGCLLTKTDDSYNVINRFHKRPSNRGIPDRVRTLYFHDKNVCYWEPYWDTVYTFTGSAFEPKYFFDLGRNRIPQKYLESHNTMDYDLNPYVWLGGFKEFESFIYFDFIDKNKRGKKLFYNKLNKTGYSIPGSLQFMNWGFVNDFLGGSLFSLDYKLSANEVCCSYEVADLKEYLAKGVFARSKANNQLMHDNFIKLIKDSKIEDNPILIIVKLK